jgi:hypothetical protein
MTVLRPASMTPDEGGIGSNREVRTNRVQRADLGLTEAPYGVGANWITDGTVILRKIWHKPSPFCSLSY